VIALAAILAAYSCGTIILREASFEASRIFPQASEKSHSADRISAHQQAIFC
jgi:hypothetical protein